jgi:hypothetical protein
MVMSHSKRGTPLIFTNICLIQEQLFRKNGRIEKGILTLADATFFKIVIVLFLGTKTA